MIGPPRPTEETEYEEDEEAERRLRASEWEAVRERAKVVCYTHNNKSKQNKYNTK